MSPLQFSSFALSDVNYLRRYVASLNQSKDALLKLYYVENLLITNA